MEIDGRCASSHLEVLGPRVRPVAGGDLVRDVRRRCVRRRRARRPSHGEQLMMIHASICLLARSSSSRGSCSSLLNDWLRGFPPSRLLPYGQTRWREAEEPGPDYKPAATAADQWIMMNLPAAAHVDGDPSRFTSHLARWSSRLGACVAGQVHRAVSRLQ
jgi:hypothetical protein